MISTEGRRHAVHILFGEVSYGVTSVHWRVNNKRKRKKYSFSVTTINISILSNENIKTFKFSLVLRTCDNTGVFIALDENIYGTNSKRVNPLCIKVYATS